MAELVFFRRGEEVLRLAMDHQRVVLGRGERCDVVIPDPEVSRSQVALWLEGDRCVFQDVSGKGTVVSGARAQEGVVADGADIALGQWRAVYRAHSRGDDGATEVSRATELSLRPEAADAPRVPAQVRVKTGAETQIHKVSGDTFTIGKDTASDVVIPSRFVSGRHLKVVRQHNRFLVSDQHSTNGTYLGSFRVFEVDVPFHTTFKLGEVEVTIEPLSASPRGVPSYYGIIGGDPSIKQLAELIEKVAPSTAAVAVFGESGTGKELVAQAIHTRSTRADSPFIPVNCAAISRELIESELFGHEKGAFTGAMTARKGAFEEADGGTIFLDEVGELPLELQAKLLRALESGEIKRVGASRPSTVDVRVVAATNRDLMAAAREGKFREDLYYRLCVVPLTLVPLRNRRSDIIPLAEHFVRVYSPRGQSIHITDKAARALEGHGWPGNVRELRNVIHRAMLFRKGAHIEDTDLTFDGRSSMTATATGSEPFELIPGQSLAELLERGERLIIEAALKKYNNNRERVAKELQVARSTLFKRLKDWGMTQSED